MYILDQCLLTPASINYVKSSRLANVHTGQEGRPTERRPVCRPCKAPVQNTEQASPHIYVKGGVKTRVEF